MNVCSQGTCQQNVKSCWHAGDKVEQDNVVVFLVKSYGQWAWKIGEATLPRPVAGWMEHRRTAKKKRLKARRKRKEQRAIRNSSRTAGVGRASTQS